MRRSTLHGLHRNPSFTTAFACSRPPHLWVLKVNKCDGLLTACASDLCADVVMFTDAVDAAELGTGAVAAGKALLDNFANMWVADMTTLVNKMEEWTPAGWQARKDHLISDVGMQRVLSSVHIWDLGVEF